MKKNGFTQGMFLVVAAFVCVALIFGSTWASAEEKIEGPLYVESWGGSYGDAVRDYIINPFKKKYGIEVRHNFFANNSEQLAKWKTGKTNMDISFLANDFVYQAMIEDLLLPIRVENVPNYRYLFDKFKNPPFDPGPKVYCISYIWGDQAIAWNTEKVDKPESWSALWDERYKGHVALMGGEVWPILEVALFLGQDPNKINDIDAIMKKLRELRPNLLKFWSSGADLTSSFATREIWIADFWRGRVNNLKKEGHPVQYTQPKEGTIGWVDAIVIPKGAKHRRAAEAFLNFALTKDAHTNYVTKGITYAPTTSLVQLTQEQEDMLGANPELRKRVVFMNPAYYLKNRDNWNQLMNELKSGM